MKRLSLITLTILLAMGCQRSDANPLENKQPTGTVQESSTVSRLTSCYDADEWTCEVEAAIVRKTNEKRAELKRASLEQVFETSYIARGHSKVMPVEGISHNGFKERFDALREALPGIRIGAGAENVAWMSFSQDDPELVAAEFVKMWWNSKGHKANMEGAQYRYIGVGVVRTDDNRVFATQMFH